MHGYTVDKHAAAKDAWPRSLLLILGRVHAFRAGDEVGTRVILRDRVLRLVCAQAWRIDLLLSNDDLHNR